MLLGDVGAPEWLTSVGSGILSAGRAAGTAGAQAGLTNVLSKIGGSAPGAAPAPVAKTFGIPQPVLIIGASVLGVVLLAKLFGGRSSPRPAVANPRRRRRRRARRRRGGRR